MSGRGARRGLRAAAEIGLALLLVSIARSALAERYDIPSGSMEPTLLIGDTVAATKFNYGYSTAMLPFAAAPPPGGRLLGMLPARGDIVIFRAPADPSAFWVKRVIGLPGDTVALHDGRPWLNGQPLAWRDEGPAAVEESDGTQLPAERFAETLPGGATHAVLKLRQPGPRDEMPPVTVPAGMLFVMGDNRDESADSRYSVAEGGVGLLPLWSLQGKVAMVLGSRDIATPASGVAGWLASIRTERFFRLPR